jgi:hypothetical protein
LFVVFKKRGLLVAVNANDRLQFNMQHNVLPVAAAKNMGIIAMKVFADNVSIINILIVSLFAFRPINPIPVGSCVRDKKRVA